MLDAFRLPVSKTHFEQNLTENMSPFDFLNQRVFRILFKYANVVQFIQLEFDMTAFEKH